MVLCMTRTGKQGLAYETHQSMLLRLKGKSTYDHVHDVASSVACLAGEYGSKSLSFEVKYTEPLYHDSAITRVTLGAGLYLVKS